MSKKSDKLVEALMDAAYQDGREYGEPGDVTKAWVALTNYITGLHQRIAELHRGNARLTQWNNNQSDLIRRWRSRAVALGHVTEIDGVVLDSKDQPGYQGHAGTTGGLQQHSVGELYPCIIAKVGQHWQVDHASLGTLQSNFPTQADAVAYAKHFKDNDR